ncbi:hypothetical protein [Maribacter sp. HTCC2170]|uniref:hypothetical protein n=1 Tax=Maribacter sp. (strain HTCC2170 / KCCM 42371) TaxID=313603 RepID=UPI00006B1B13|nr:hypothetical protein [Maribacter sp. HTCC2170]EAR00763.1 hypothetical protein FB2170_16801 [Maribacter sp. HTCC2170]
MKKNLRKVKFMGSLLLAICVLGSCDKDDSQNISEDMTITATELNASDEADLIIEDVVNIGEEVYATDEIMTTSKADYRSDYLPDCVTITTVLTSTSKEKSIDFGEGCELPNGNILSGIIQLSYLKDMDLATKTLSMSLENFTFNGVAVDGNASIVRMRNNENGNPESNAEADFEGNWPDGDSASFSANRTREWIEGYGSGYWGDNAFLISGKATYTGKLGNVFMKETIVPLRRELSCRFIVSGILEISRNDATASLDFGDGSCDAKGILTHPDGESEEIFLRRFKH